jgi:hypothetical protein
MRLTTNFPNAVKEKIKRLLVGSVDEKMEAMRTIHTSQYARSEEKPQLKTLDLVRAMQGGRFDYLEGDGCYSMTKRMGTNDGAFVYQCATMSNDCYAYFTGLPLSPTSIYGWFRNTHSHSPPKVSSSTSSSLPSYSLFLKYPPNDFNSEGKSKILTQLLEMIKGEDEEGLKHYTAARSKIMETFLTSPASTAPKA